MIVADDDPELRAWLSLLLRCQGCSVRAVRSGEQLLDCVAASMMSRRQGIWPDLLFVDVRMPGFSGLQVLEGLERYAALIPIVIMTAQADDAVVARAREHGACAFLRKPFSALDLTVVVETMLGRAVVASTS